MKSLLVLFCVFLISSKSLAQQYSFDYIYNNYKIFISETQSPDTHLLHFRLNDESPMVLNPTQLKSLSNLVNTTEEDWLRFGARSQFAVIDGHWRPNEEEIETFVEEEEADFPGGYAAMAKFINDNIDYPQEAIDLGIKGRVTLRFVVEKDGRISNISVQTPLAGCKACDKAAVKLVEKMPSWSAGKNGGRAVRTYVTLPIKFEVN